MNPISPPTGAARAASVRRHNAAFTLVELLAAIVIAGILAAIIVSVTSKVRRTARSAVCVSNLKNIGAAFQLYAADNKNMMPALRWRDRGEITPQQNPSKGNWQKEISPYLSRSMEGKFRDAYYVDADIYAFCPEYVHLYRDDPRWGKLETGGYGMNSHLIANPWGWDDVYETRRQRNRIVNPAQTILVGDSTDYHLTINKEWPEKTEVRPGGYESGDPDRHGSHANYLFADGHVQTLSPDAALKVLTAILP